MVFYASICVAEFDLKNMTVGKVLNNRLIKNAPLSKAKLIKTPAKLFTRSFSWHLSCFI
jgi:hypothetical protein